MSDVEVTFTKTISFDHWEIQRLVEDYIGEEVARAKVEADKELAIKRGQIEMLSGQVDDLKAERARLKDGMRILRIMHEEECNG